MLALTTFTYIQFQVDWRSIKSVVRYFFDGCVTHYVIITLAILAWRSIMTICDKIMHYDDVVWSNVVSLIIGFTGCVTLFVLEIPLAEVNSTAMFLF
jgi:hypothetical protein